MRVAFVGRAVRPDAGSPQRSGRSRDTTRTQARSTPGSQRAATYAAPPSTSQSHEYTTNPVPVPYPTIRNKEQFSLRRDRTLLMRFPPFDRRLSSGVSPNIRAQRSSSIAVPTGTWRVGRVGRVSMAAIRGDRLPYEGRSRGLIRRRRGTRCHRYRRRHGHGRRRDVKSPRPW